MYYRSETAYVHCNWIIHRLTHRRKPEERGTILLRIALPSMYLFLFDLLWQNKISSSVLHSELLQRGKPLAGSICLGVMLLREMVILIKSRKQLVRVIYIWWMQIIFCPSHLHWLRLEITTNAAPRKPTRT